MTGAAIVRWEAGSAAVLAVHGAFDGASAWALRVEMEESRGREFVIDLTHAVEACDFAASVVATWQRSQRDRHVRFRIGSPEQARLLARWGLEVIEGSAEASVALPQGFVSYPSPGAAA